MCAVISAATIAVTVTVAVTVAVTVTAPIIDADACIIVLSMTGNEAAAGLDTSLSMKNWTPKQVATFLVQCHDNDSNKALRIAAKAGKVRVCRELLSRSGVHAGSGIGQSALSLAAENGHADVVGLLMDPTATMCTVDEWFYMSPGSHYNHRVDAMRKAADNGHLEVVRMLLDPKTMHDCPLYIDKLNSTTMMLVVHNGWMTHFDPDVTNVRVGHLLQGGVASLLASLEI